MNFHDRLSRLERSRMQLPAQTPGEPPPSLCVMRGQLAAVLRELAELVDGPELERRCISAAQRIAVGKLDRRLLGEIRAITGLVLGGDA